MSGAPVNTSIRRKLTLALVAVLLVTWIGSALFSYVESNHEIEEVFDAELAQMSRVLQGLVPFMLDHESGVLVVDDPRLSESDDGDEEILDEGLGHRYEKKMAFQVWDQQGALRLRGPVALPVTPSYQPGYGWLVQDHALWRTFVIIDSVKGLHIRTALRSDVRTELSEELAFANALPMLVGLPLVLLTVWLVISWGFRPLQHLERVLRRMSPTQLQPLDESSSPLETRQLVQAFNGLLQRLQRAFEHERRFTADAAHELRTPLAVLRLKLEGLPDDAQRRDLLAAADRMAHLVEQMLLLSRVDPDSVLETTSLDLAERVSERVAEIAPLAWKHQIEPVFDAAPHLPTVRANAALLDVLLRNLLINAIQHNPAGEPIEVRVSGAGERVCVEVCDHGPGIAVTERERVLDRFVRLDQRRGQGAGLGLSIAKRIAQQHGATLTLSEREDGASGLRVTCCFVPG